MQSIIAKTKINEITPRVIIIAVEIDLGHRARTQRLSFYHVYWVPQKLPQI